MDYFDSGGEDENACVTPAIKRKFKRSNSQPARPYRPQRELVKRTVSVDASRSSSRSGKRLKSRRDSVSSADSTSSSELSIDSPTAASDDHNKFVGKQLHHPRQHGRAGDSHVVAKKSSAALAAADKRENLKGVHYDNSSDDEPLSVSAGVKRLQTAGDTCLARRVVHAEKNNNDAGEYGVYHNKAVGVYNNGLSGGSGGEQICEPSPLAGGEAPDGADFLVSSHNDNGISEPPRSAQGSDSESQNQLPESAVSVCGATPTEARWSHVPPKKRWLPRTLSGQVLVTDVTCNCVTVTFLESRTEKGFFKQSSAPE